MDQGGVEPLDVPRARVPVQDLVGDGGGRQEERGADADGQREGAHAEADLEVRKKTFSSLKFINVERSPARSFFQ